MLIRSRKRYNVPLFNIDEMVKILQKDSIHFFLFMLLSEFRPCVHMYEKNLISSKIHLHFLISCLNQISDFFTIIFEKCVGTKKTLLP
jgi:hypothetical protein